MATFPSLYDYSSTDGVVIPKTTEIRKTIEDSFREIFGNEIDVSQETAIGRLIEAITLFFKDVCGVNAQNANALNPQAAAGAQLDAIGALFGLERLDGGNENDGPYRTRILSSQSTGKGYVESIRNAVGQVDGVTSVCVYDNGHYDPKMMPDAETGGNRIAVPGHSVFISVGGDYDDMAVAKAIASTKSLGCGYTKSNEYGTKTSGYRKEIGFTDETTGSYTEVIFYKSRPVVYRFEITVVNVGYAGSSITSAVDEALASYLNDNPARPLVTKSNIISAITSATTGIYVSSVKLFKGTTEETQIKLYPYEYVDVSNCTIVISVA